MFFIMLVLVVVRIIFKKNLWMLFVFNLEVIFGFIFLLFVLDIFLF